MNPGSNDSTLAEHAKFMRRAVQLTRRGFPAPNPPVGCVLVRDGQIIGEGWPTYAGGPHAERVALMNTPDAQGATAYVTLEPCNHQGRTGPCSEALIAAGIREVYVAVLDPNPRAQGGVERLREAGVVVHVGLLAEQAEASNERFLTAMRRSWPFVTVKAAMSLDGRIALPSGESKWITGSSARREGHRFRAEMGAVLVGYRTVLADDPELTARIPGVVNQPLRIVLDPHGRLSGRERVFNSAAPSRHVTGPIDLKELLAELFREGVTGILVEGGAGTISRFVAESLVDRYEIFAAPKLLGDGPTWLAALRLGALADAPQLRLQRVQRRGEDVQLTLRPADSPR